MVTLLDGLRVLDLSTEIAGPYATKLLADGGADVIKVEGREGDPLRGWTASHRDLEGRDGALFQFVNTSKRSVVGDVASPHVAALVADADLLLEDGQLSDRVLAELRADHPELVVVSITPFGRSGPWAHRPATEFTLQAWCGSTASRGTVDREPLHAGGRLGEWITGAYAAVAALAALRAPQGDHVDVSMLECMTITLGGFGALYTALLGALDGAKTYPGPFRSCEAPSIEPTADGLVGFCTITGQQFEDFLLLIDHPELRGDPRFATAGPRTSRYAEFTDMVRQWTAARTTEQIIEQASLLRIPVAPVGTPDTITTFDHFVERGVFVRNPGGGFAQPRPPYRVDGVPLRPLTAAPSLGQHTAGAAWSRRASARPTVDAPAGRPLDGVRIVDLTAFWAGPSVTQMLAALGADVIKVEGLQRPDGMRFSSTKPATTDGWWEWSPVFHAVNTNKRGVTLDMGTDEGRRLVLDLIAQADGVVENFSPRVLDGFGITWDVISARNPRMIMVRMPAFGLDGPWRDRTGFAQTMEQTSGMAWMSGFADAQPVIPRGPCDPLAGMHAAVAFLAALHERERSGVGRFIEVTMIEAALNAAAEVVIEHSAYGQSLRRDGNRGPVAAPQGLYPCAGTEQWLALAVADDDQWHGLRKVLDDPTWAAAPELADAAGRRAAHDRIDDHLRTWCATRALDDIVLELTNAGVAAAPVLGTVRVLDVEPLRTRGFVETTDHPVIGRNEQLGIPFRLASRDGPWFAAPSPTLGQHNREVLGDVLGLSDDEIEQLAAAGVIGERPSG